MVWNCINGMTFVMKCAQYHNRMAITPLLTSLDASENAKQVTVTLGGYQTFRSYPNMTIAPAHRGRRTRRQDVIVLYQLGLQCLLSSVIRIGVGITGYSSASMRSDYM